MAVSLIESLAGDFDPNAEHDAYSEALQALVNAKAQGAAPPERPGAPAPDNVTDLLAALRASVEATSGSRGKSAKKATAKKAAEKKTSEKKTTAKKRKSA